MIISGTWLEYDYFFQFSNGTQNALQGKCQLAKMIESWARWDSPHLPAPKQLGMKLGSSLQANMVRSKYLHRPWSSQVMFTKPWAQDEEKTNIPNCQMPSTQHQSFDVLPYNTWPGLPLYTRLHEQTLKLHHHLSQVENTFPERANENRYPASCYFIQTEQALDTKAFSVKQPTFSSSSVC